MDSTAAANRRKANPPKRLTPQSLGGEQHLHLHQQQQLRQQKSRVNSADQEDCLTPTDEAEDMQRQSNNSSSNSASCMSLNDYLRLVTAAASAPLDLTKASSTAPSDRVALPPPTPPQPPIGPLFLPFPPLGGLPPPPLPPPKHQQPPTPVRPQSASSPASSVSGGIVGANGNGCSGVGFEPTATKTLNQCAEAALQEATSLASAVTQVLRGLQQPAVSEVQKARSLIDGAQQKLTEAHQMLAEYERLLQTLQAAQQQQQQQMQEMALAAAAAAAAASSAIPPTVGHLPLTSLSNHARHRQLTGNQQQQRQHQLEHQLEPHRLPPTAAGVVKKLRKDPRCQDGPEKDWVDPSFVPSVSSDGKHVILSDTHPAVRMTLADYQESICRASGSATRHLRILMKHFFSQGTLARSSLTGNGQYKEVLDENLTMGIRDYIQHRYPKLKAAKINLCCTDVCVQARRVIEKQARVTTSSSTRLTPITSPPSAQAAQAAVGTANRDSSSMDDGGEVEADDEAGSVASSHDLTPDLNPGSLSLHRLHPIDSPMN